MLEYKYLKGGSMNQHSEFIDWLINNKNYSKKSASDAYSRCKRAEKLTGKKISKKTPQLLSNCDEFVNLSVYVRSQINRAVTLWNEFVTVK